MVSHTLTPDHDLIGNGADHEQHSNKRYRMSLKGGHDAGMPTALPLAASGLLRRGHVGFMQLRSAVGGQMHPTGAGGALQFNGQSV